MTFGDERLKEARRLMREYRDARAGVQALLGKVANLSAGEVPVAGPPLDPDEWDKRITAERLAERAWTAFLRDKQWWPGD